MVTYKHEEKTVTLSGGNRTVWNMRTGGRSFYTGGEINTHRCIMETTITEGGKQQEISHFIPILLVF